MFRWLNELYELSHRMTPSGLPWDSQAIIRREYYSLLAWFSHHYDMVLTSDGWTGTPKPNWRSTCIECSSMYVVDGQRCRSCADGL